VSRQDRVPLSALDNVRASRERVEKVSLKVFELEIIKEVCYRFASSGFETITVADDTNEVEVRFRLPSTVSEKEEEALVQRFHHELLDQDLRKTVAGRTEIVRNLILANAFANTALVSHDED